MKCHQCKKEYANPTTICSVCKSRLAFENFDRNLMFDTSRDSQAWHPLFLFIMPLIMSIPPFIGLCLSDHQRHETVHRFLFFAYGAVHGLIFLISLPIGGFLGYRGEWITLSGFYCFDVVLSIIVGAIFGGLIDSWMAERIKNIKKLLGQKISIYKRVSFLALLIGLVWPLIITSLVWPFVDWKTVRIFLIAVLVGSIFGALIKSINAPSLVQFIGLLIASILTSGAALFFSNGIPADMVVFLTTILGSGVFLGGILSSFFVSRFLLPNRGKGGKSPVSS